MTLEEYFIGSKPQPVNNKLMAKDKLYRYYSTIDFAKDDNHYAKIFIAHPDDDIWALGFEIKDGNARVIIRRDPSPCALTRGKIDKLVYGMTKVLERNLSNYNSKTIWKVVENAIRDSYPYYVSRDYKTPKIMI